MHAGDLIKSGSASTAIAGSASSPHFPSSTRSSARLGAAHASRPPAQASTAGLCYGVASGHYTYGWQTSAAWAGTCRRFDLTANDGTAAHSGMFMFFA